MGKRDLSVKLKTRLPEFVPLYLNSPIKLKYALLTSKNTTLPTLAFTDHELKQPINRQPKTDTLLVKFNQFKILHATENSGSTVFDLNTGAIAHVSLCTPCLLYCQLTTENF
jgi:hypothetical protein